MRTSDRPNIVLVTIDSLRADYCGYLNNSKNHTPTLSALAEDGIAFHRAIAPGPSTPESMPVIFTGEYPVSSDSSINNRLAERRTRIRNHLMARNTIPERMSSMGYSTAAFTPNPFTSRHFGFNKEFDYFQDFMHADSNSSSAYQRLFESFLRGNQLASFFRIIRNMLQREEVFKPWESYYNEFIDWIRSAERPYFVWVFLMDAHNPYLPSKDCRSQSRLDQFYANYRFWRESHETPFSPGIHDRLVTAYEDAVRYADSFLDRLLADLDEPVTIVHGDHGEAFGEHGTYGHEPYLHPENVHVPLVIHNHGRERVRHPVSLRSLPTILTSIGENSDLNSNEGSYVSTRSAASQRWAFYTKNSHWIKAKDDKPKTGLGEEASECFRSLISNVEEADAEKLRLNRSADSLVNT